MVSVKWEKSKQEFPWEIIGKLDPGKYWKQ